MYIVELYYTVLYCSEYFSTLGWGERVGMSLKMSLNRRWIFKQDYNPKHTARIVKQYFTYINSIYCMLYPPSLYSYKVENWWPYLKKKVRKIKALNFNELEEQRSSFPLLECSKLCKQNQKNKKRLNTVI